MRVDRLIHGNAGAPRYLTDRYVSESIIAVRQAGGDGGALPGAALLLVTTRW